MQFTSLDFVSDCWWKQIWPFNRPSNGVSFESSYIWELCKSVLVVVKPGDDGALFLMKWRLSRRRWIGCQPWCLLPWSKLSQKLPGWHSAAAVAQVWSLTQFYSVELSQSRICVKKCSFIKRTIKICASFCWRCHGTSAPSAAHLTVSLYLCSSRSNAQGELRPLEGHCVSWKSPSRVQDRDEGVAGRNGKK